MKDLKPGFRSMYWKIFILLISFACTAMSAVNAQLSDKIHEQMRFKHFTIDDGLTNNRVRGLTQDRYGFVWMGTRMGITRYDGFNLKQYKRYYTDSTDLLLSETNGMISDPKGTIWASGNYGLCYYDRAKDKFMLFRPDALNGESTQSSGLDMDEQGNIWFGITQGLLKYNPESGESKLYAHDPDDPGSMPPGAVFKVKAISRGHIWYAFKDDGGAGYINPQTDEIKYFEATGEPGALSENKNERIYEGSKGYIWIGHNTQGASRFSYESGTFKNFYPEPGVEEAGRVRGLIEDIHGNFWFGTMAGLYLFNREDQTFRRYAHASHPISTLSHNSIQQMIVDDHEGLWIGTFAGGVSYTNLNTSGFVKYEYNHIPSPYFLNDKNVYSLFVDDDENIWVGTENGGINFLDVRTGKFTYYTHDPDDPNTPPSNNIKDIYIDNQERVWFGTYRGGFSMLDQNTGNFTHYRQTEEFPGGINDETVFIVYPDVMDNNILWIACTNNMYKFRKDEKSFTLMSPDTDEATNIPEYARVYSICHTDDNKMIFGGNKIMILDRETNETEVIEEINGNTFTSADFSVMDKYGYLWTSIDKRAIVRINPDDHSHVVFDQEDGLPEIEYLEGAIDEMGNLWTSTTQGIVKFENIIENQDTVIFKQFDISDNLQSLEFLYHSKATSPTGEILFGGINGFNSFHPKNVAPNPYVPNVIVTKLSVANNDVQVGEKIHGKKILDKPIMEQSKLTFHHKIKIFTFEFAGFHFVAPENNQFRYKLKGFEDDWNVTGSNVRSATYSNIPQGNYTFMVDGTNNNGKWSEDPFTLDIKVTPPFWKTIWFLTLVIIFIGAIIYTFIKLREKQLRHDKLVLENKIKASMDEIDKQKEQIELKNSELEEKIELEKYHKWFADGQVKISETLSANKGDIHALSNAFLTELVKYLEVEQGAVYALNNETEGDEYLEMVASYALDTDKQKQDKFYPGEGLVGACFADDEVVKTDDLPEGYAKLTSGLGTSELTHLLLVPVRLNEIVYGVIEILSLKEIEDQKIEFISKVGESYASILNILKAGEKTQKLLEQQKLQSEELTSNEEELRQNLEEMKAIQEDAERQKQKVKELVQEHQEKEEYYTAEIARLKETIAKMEKA